MTHPLLQERAAKLEHLRPVGGKPIDNGGGPPHDGNMDFVTPREFAAEIKRLEERIDGHVSRIEVTAKETIAAVKNLKSTMIVTAAASALTVVFGVAAFNATVLSNMVASFESGKNTASAIASASADLAQTKDQLRAIQEQLSKNDKQPKK